MNAARVLSMLPLMAIAACTPPAARTPQDAEPVNVRPIKSTATAPETRAANAETRPMSPPPPASGRTARPSGTSTETTPDMPRVQPGLPGERIAGSLIAIPGQVRAGQTLSGQVPAGSRVTVNGVAASVDARGGFRHPVPANAAGTLTVRVEHPVDGAPLTQRVRVTPP